MTIEKNVPEKSAKTSLPWEILLAAAVKKTSLNSSKEDFATKRFPSSTKRKLSIHLNFPSPFVSLLCSVTLKCETLVLKTTSWCDSHGRTFPGGPDDGWRVAGSASRVTNCQAVMRYPPRALRRLYCSRNALWVTGLITDSVHFLTEETTHFMSLCMPWGSSMIQWVMSEVKKEFANYFKSGLYNPNHCVNEWLVYKVNYWHLLRPRGEL